MQKIAKRLLPGLAVLMASAISVNAQDTGGEGEVSGVFPAPAGFIVCQVAYGASPAVRLSWEITERFESFDIYVDGILRDDVYVDGAARMAEIDVTAGEHTFELEGVVGDATSEPSMPITLEVLTASPVTRPIVPGTIRCLIQDEGSGTIDVSWELDGEVDDWQSGELRLGGRLGNHTFARGDTAQGSAQAGLSGTRPGKVTVAFHEMEDDMLRGYFSEPIEVECFLAGPTILRGDCDLSGVINLSDAVFLLNHRLGLERWSCDDVCDANDDGSVTFITDAVAVLSYLFVPQSAPNVTLGVCEIDFTEDFLGGVCTGACN
ncbi:MAG: dockerin type I repeat-containing protein [Planctomycetota bacterium]